MKNKFLNTMFLLTILSVIFTSIVLFFVFSGDLNDLYEKILPVDITIFVVLSAVYLGLLKHFRDVSAKMVGEMNNNENTKDKSFFENRDKLRREMFSNVSHELKTPLTTIRGYAEMMENGMVPPEDIPVIAGKMNEESCHMLVLIDRVMKSMDHPEVGILIKDELFDMKKIASEVAGRLYSRAESKNIKIIVEGDSVMLNSDKNLFGQICYNLVDNAVKYSKNGGEVRILTEETSIGKRLLVVDRGIGISEEDQKRIFDRFFRGDRSHSRKVDGSGLGLSIVKHHVDVLGADLVLHSELGRGTEISILFK